MAVEFPNGPSTVTLDEREDDHGSCHRKDFPRWADDRKRRRKTRVPDEIRLETKPQIALGQIRQALEDDIEPGVVLADVAYGNDSAFRNELAQRGLEYVVGIRSSTTVWRAWQGPLPAKKYSGRGRPPKRLRRGKQQPVTVKELAGELLAIKAFRALSWREGTGQTLRSRFAAVRVRPARRDYEQHEPHPEQWLLIEWPAKQAEPTHYWLANLGVKRPARIWSGWPSTAGSSSATTRSSSKSWDWVTTKDAAGGAFIITPPFALRRMGSWWLSGAFFSPRHESTDYSYPSPSRRGTSARAGAARFDPSGITRARLRRCGGKSVATFCVSFLAVLFVAPAFYNTVVLGTLQRVFRYPSGSRSRAESLIQFDSPLGHGGRVPEWPLHCDVGRTGGRSW